MVQNNDTLWNVAPSMTTYMSTTDALCYAGLFLANFVLALGSLVFFSIGSRDLYWALNKFKIVAR